MRRTEPWLFLSLGFGAGIALALLTFQVRDFSAKSKGWKATRSGTGKVQTTSASNGKGRGPAGDQRYPVQSDSLRAALQSRQQGNYVLDSDILWVRERLTKQVKDSVAYIMDFRDPQYEKLFSELEIDPDTSAKLRSHIAQVYRAKVEIGQAMTGLVNAQVAYDDRMRSILKEKYDQYVSYESLDRTRREGNSLVKFIEATNLGQVDADEIRQIQMIIGQNGAYSSKTLDEWGGPFDDLPKVFGGRWTLGALEQRYVELTNGAAALMDSAKEMQLSETARRALNEYYSMELTNQKKRIQEAVKFVPKDRHGGG